MSTANCVTIRVWGDFACFTRPEMKVERVSYPVMTPSAARGILEAIYWEPQMYYVIHQVAVVKKGQWFTFRRNEIQKVISIPEVWKWMRGTKDVGFIHAGGGGGDAAQRNMLALAQVEYLITAEIKLTKKAQPPGDNIGKYADQLRHRATKGKCFHRPALGCREFAADFDLVEEPANHPQATGLNEDLGLMLYDVFDPHERLGEGCVRPQPVFFKARLQDGILDCHPDRVEIVRPIGGRS